MLGTSHQSANVSLSAHRTTRFHCVGVAGNVRVSCLSANSHCTQEVLGTLLLLSQAVGIAALDSIVLAFNDIHFVCWI